MDTDEKRFDSIIELVIGCALNVGSVLKSGFMEKCYDNALAHELHKAGLPIGLLINFSTRVEIKGIAGPELASGEPS